MFAVLEVLWPKLLVSFWEVQCVAVFVFSFSLSLCPWGFASCRQDVCWTAVSEFLLWSGSACLPSALLLLSSPVAPVPVCLWMAALKSNSLVLCIVDRSELQQYFLEIQTALSHGRRKMKSVESLRLCFPAAERQSPSLPKRSRRNTTPFSLFFIFSLPTFLLVLFLTFSHTLFPSLIPFILSFCNLFLLTSAFLPHLCTAFSRHHYNIWEIQCNVDGWIDYWYSLLI